MTWYFDYRSVDTHVTPCFDAIDSYDGLGGFEQTYKFTGSTKHDRFGYALGYYGYTSPGYFGSGYSNARHVSRNATKRQRDDVWKGSGGAETRTNFAGYNPQLPYAVHDHYARVLFTATDLLGQHAEFAKLRYDVTPRRRCPRYSRRVFSGLSPMNKELSRLYVGRAPLTN